MNGALVSSAILDGAISHRAVSNGAAALDVPITALYGGLLALGFSALSAMVIRARRTQGINLGHGGDVAMERRIRGHANFAEYVPLSLLLLLVLELSGAPAQLLHGLGVSLVAGRSLHAYALVGSGSSPRCRVGGMALTLTSLGVSAFSCLRFALQ